MMRSGNAALPHSGLNLSKTMYVKKEGDCFSRFIYAIDEFALLTSAAFFTVFVCNLVHVRANLSCNFITT